MTTRKLICDQAIFTSSRGPGGQGYRITAASRGLRPDAKQIITRRSPSHDALCRRPDDPVVDGMIPGAVSFYALPDDRRCVGYSCYAGAEQTGRGGHRVYTLNVVFSKEDFAVCGYNPFTVVRALIKSELTKPILKPPPVLPPLELTIDEAPGSVAPGRPERDLTLSWYAYLARELRDGRKFVVNMSGDWSAALETVLFGIPGELRAAVSFSAGIKFSVARRHHLMLLDDEQAVARTRLTGQPIDFLEPDKQQPPPVDQSEWSTLVTRCLSQGKTATLARRTSLRFSDTSHTGCERVARLYNEMDRIPDTPTPELLDVAHRYLDAPEEVPETDIAAELVVTAQNVLLRRLKFMAWTEVRPVWSTLCKVRTKSMDGRLFASPLIERALEAAHKRHPMIAAEAALDLARQQVASTGESTHDPVVDRVLTKLADWAQNAPDTEISKLPALCERWRVVRPSCSIVEYLIRRCTSQPTGATA